MSQKVARNVTSLIVSRLVAGALVLVGYAAIFRYLGVFRTGEYQFALAYVTLFAVAVDFGIEQLVIKKVSENKEDAEKYLGNFFATEFILALVVYAAILLVAHFNHYDPLVQKTIAIIGLGTFINALTIPHTAIISAFEDMHILATVNFFDSVINVSVMFAVILLHQSIAFLAIVQALFGIMHLLVYSRIIKRYVPHAHLFKYLEKLDFKLIYNMLYAALPFGSLVGFSILYNKIDVIILSHIRGYAEAGLYTVAYKFFDFMAFFPAVVSSSLYPFFSSQMKLGNIELIKSTLEKYTKYMILLALPVAFGGAVLAPNINLLMAGFNRQFYPGFMALQFLVFGTATLFIYSGVNSLMISQLTKYAVYVTFANIFINSIGNLLLIPHFGFRAAAFMTFISELTQATFYFYMVNKKIVKFSFLPNFWLPLLGAVVMALVLYKIRFMPLFFTIPLGALVYGLIVFLSGFVKFSDITNFKNILTRTVA